MSDDHQIPIPPSFDAVHAGPRGRCNLPRAALHARYELCEDMAQMLVEHCQSIHHDQGVDEALVLQRTEAGLASAESGFDAAEAGWVVTRLAELLGWHWPGLQAVLDAAAAGATRRPRRG